MNDLNKVFDDEVRPLLEQIVKICKANKMPYLMSFAVAKNSKEIALRSVIGGVPADVIPGQFHLAMGIISGDIKAVPIPMPVPNAPVAGTTH